MIKTENKYAFALGVVFLFVCIMMIGYVIPRENFPLEIGFLALGVGGFFLAIKPNQISNIFTIGIILRGILILAIPILSDDYFRFLWDGFLSSEGINPFDFKPSELESIYQNHPYASQLISKMNSPNYYSIYPPVSQWIFYLASLSQSLLGGIIIIRLFILGFEIGTYFIIKEILKRFSIDPKRIALYWLNPIVIIELTGNLHAEGILVFFLLYAALNLAKLKDIKGGVLLALSFCSKLFSLMFLPILVLKGGKYRSAKLFIGLIPIFLLSFSPFLKLDNLGNYAQSLQLYFQSFEFNGSFFNLIRWIGFQLKGYDVVQIAGPILSLISGVTISFISWRYQYSNRKVIFSLMALMISIYFFLSPIVHPWYIIVPFSLTLFGNFKFAQAWLFLGFLSYAFYDENVPEILKTSLIWIEYGVIFYLLKRDVKTLKAA